MVNDTLQEKLESLRRCIARLESKKPKTLEELENNIDLQDIIAINLERAIQLCVDSASIIISQNDDKSPQTMSDCFRCLAETQELEATLAERLIQAVGFRNLSVHSYEKIDWQIIHQILDTNLADLKDFAAMITARL
jgi:uncharacterized protein YutE (UPF0331/DUF86 family)